MENSIQSLQGAIRVDTVPGKGSVFRVLFPMVSLDVRQEAVRVESVVRGDSNARILLVDDEDTLLSIGRQMLEHLGYRVTTKNNSVEALECFREHPEEFDLIITDQTMPKLTGSDLAAALIDIRPDIPIILCSGYADRIDEVRMKTLGIRELVQKPFVFTELAEIARTVLVQQAA